MCNIILGAAPCLFFILLVENTSSTYHQNLCCEEKNFGLELSSWITFKKAEGSID